MGKVVNFGFNADPVPSGHLNYWDKDNDIHLVSDSITSFTQTGPKKVVFTGNGHVGNNPVMFQVEIEDNGEPGIGNDRFKIVITGYPIREGVLTQGNIQIHY